MTEEVTVEREKATDRQERTFRLEPSARPPEKADPTAHTAANLYSLLTWLYGRQPN
ncbi:MAG: hypothetical protein ACM3Q1_11550 [Bacteroidales bacterium]